jgi:hypothetical protein
MSDQWVADSLVRMGNSTDPKVRATAREVLPFVESKSSILTKELWHHDLATGATTVRLVGSTGKPGAVLRSWQDSFISNRLMATCRVGSTLCSFEAP